MSLKSIRITGLNVNSDKSDSNFRKLFLKRGKKKGNLIN